MIFCENSFLIVVRRHLLIRGLSTLPPLPPSQPNTIYNQPPPPLPGTVVVPRRGPAKIISPGAPIDLTDDKQTQKREYSDSQTNRRKEKLLLRLLKRFVSEGKTFVPEKGGGLESLWTERGFDKKPPTAEEIINASQLPDHSGAAGSNGSSGNSSSTMPQRTRAMDPNLGKIDDSRKPKPMGAGTGSPAKSGVVYGASGGQGYAESNAVENWSQDVQF
ncbi:unnamed protein product [Oikopleura dioica]|uniref:Uncharacterized protein n=1 Tax=Oikopleura dioica TaxID=34765 RepID=E4YI41_OIKDI|nr:unnamed protein product [Oikopleura dioica]